MIHLSTIAARFLPQAEIVELTHDKKVDAPSGTALKTAAALARSGGRSVTSPASDARGALSDGVRIHSVRLPGLVAHQEVIFGGQGQSLTIRQDSFDRSSFMPGVLMAIKAIPGRPGFTYGLETLLGL
jgi:4-hydroxy-tetrahydrodipicolinate reductase